MRAYALGLGSEHVGTALFVKHSLQAFAVLEREVVRLQQPYVGQRGGGTTDVSPQPLGSQRHEAAAFLTPTHHVCSAG